MPVSIIFFEELFKTPIKICLFMMITASTTIAIAENNKQVRDSGTEYDNVTIDALIPLDSKEPLPTTIQIQEDQTGHPVYPELLGINHNWYQSNRLVMDGQTHQINPDFIEAAKSIPMPLARMSGTVARYYFWKKAIGPWKEREPMQVVRREKPHRYGLGPLEWVDSCLQIDPNCRFTWTLNILNDTNENHADLAELFLSDGKTNPNGGKNWGQVRIDYGLKEPVPVLVWELGNELEHQHPGSREISAEQYIQMCREAIAAVRSVDPDAKFAALAATSPWDKKRPRVFDTWQGWHREILRELGDDIDYITFHPYYHGIAASKMREYVDDIAKDIKEITGSDRIKIYNSEHARWPGRDKDGPKKKNGKGKLLWTPTHSLDGCLATSEFFNLMYQSPMVGAMAYHSFNGGPWYMIDRDKKTGKFFHTGIVDLFQLYDQALGDTVVPTATTGQRADIRNNDLSFTAITMRDGDKLNLITTNRELTQVRQVDIQTNQPYEIKTAWILTADDIDAHDTAEHDALQVRQLDLAEDVDLSNLLIPPRSIIFWQLVPTTPNTAGSAPQPGHDAP